ncbi:hypothetical protein [Rhizobium leguminosarum]|uniref:hypothetical protein n=1 Tax=Rhizobium leguminosarum TaxID=384 RepID=UPI00143F23E4|nr:hypothetical protein [Rhizobium leguminosarum]
MPGFYAVNARSAAKSTRVPGEWKYLEYEISQFSEQDVSEFLHRYLRHNLPPSIAARGNSEEWISERIADFDKIRANGDLYRPVHLKIYADVAADPEVTLQKFTTYGLYSIAATRISEREGDKAVRKQIDANQRQKVIERIAWWLWDEYSGRRLFFIPDVVPEAVIGRDLLNNPVYERENIYREIFTGSFLERKFGQNYYFSHRSFLEFFVALRLENAEKNAISINSIFKNINPEILAFLKQSPSYDEFLAFIYKSLQRFSGEMPALLVEEIAAYCAGRGMADAQMAIQIMLRYFPFMRPGKEESSALIRMMIADLASNNLEHREIALYFILTALRAREVDHEVFLSLLTILAKAVDWAGFRAKVNDATITKYTYTRKDMGEYIFVRFVRIAAEMARSGQPLVSFDISKAFDEMHDKRAPKIAIGGLMALPTHGPLRFEFTEVMRDVSQRDMAVALEVLRAGVY